MAGEDIEGRDDRSPKLVLFGCLRERRKETERFDYTVLIRLRGIVWR